MGCPACVPACDGGRQYQPSQEHHQDLRSKQLPVIAEQTVAVDTSTPELIRHHSKGQTLQRCLLMHCMLLEQYGCSLGAHPDPKAQTVPSLDGEAPDELVQWQVRWRLCCIHVREGKLVLAQLQGVHTLL